MRFFWIIDIKNIAGDKVYLRRINLFRIFGYTARIHQILLPDDDRCQHDHPWGFWRLVLWNSYWEETEDGLVHVKPWRLTFHATDFRHRIKKLNNNRPVWSFVLSYPKTNEWGFFTKEGYKHWLEFVNQMAQKRVAWCEDGYTAVVTQETES